MNFSVTVKRLITRLTPSHVGMLSSKQKSTGLNLGHEDQYGRDVFV